MDNSELVRECEEEAQYVLDDLMRRLGEGQSDDDRRWLLKTSLDLLDDIRERQCWIGLLRKLEVSR